MAHYVDGFVLAVPRKKKQAYLRMARKCAKVFREYGALETRECWADDVKPGKHTSFPQAVKLKAGEAVVFAWILYPSRKVRDRCHAKSMKDPRMADMIDASKLPFDGKRLIFGGFNTILKG